MNKGHNEYFAVLAAIILAAVLASGCSTPAQTGNLYQHETQPVSYTNLSSSSASQAYYQCTNVLTQYGYQQQCYQVAAPYASSYSQYTYSKTGFAKVSEEQKAAAYADYLSTLDEDSASEMKAQFDALIAQYSK